MSLKLRYRVLRDYCKSFFSKPETWSYCKILGVIASPSSRYHKQGQAELGKRLAGNINKVIDKMIENAKNGKPIGGPSEISIPIEKYFNEPKKHLP